VVLKAVNPKDREVTVEVEVTGGFSPKTASMQLVAPGSLSARNTLAAPTVVRPEIRAVRLDGKRLAFELPAYSAAVVRLN